MNVKILSAGRVRQEFVLEGEKEYLKRLPKGIKVLCEELKSSLPLSMAKEEVIEREGQELLKRLKKDDFVVLLDEHGTQLASLKLADNIERWKLQAKLIVFVIGGAYGLSDQVRKRAQFTLSLSKLTFPHQLTRLILVEQLYRAYTITSRQPYHKD